MRTMVGTQGRQSPTIRKLKELVASGKIGKVMSTHFVGLSPREVWYWGPRINERNA
ncbi:hypothetical protein JB92DRAFT_3022206 [Gautieria morchelliformis]|nr:hypothetical protein JB92DRAFT_3022206 [Gautieria morchelliformis]